MGKIQKSNWTNSFTLIGRARVNENNFKIEETTDNGWCYSSLNLGIDSGENYGMNFCSMMGGHSTTKDSKIYVHGIKDGKDDFKNSIAVDWDDRLDDSVLDEVGDFCFIKVALEKTENGTPFPKKFLSGYDAVGYIKEHLKDGDIVRVRGNLSYRLYNGKVNMQKEITYIELWNAEPKDFCAKFNQSVLIDEDSFNPKTDVNGDFAKIHTKVLEYIKEVGGREIRGQFPLPVDFDYQLTDGKMPKAVYEKLFKIGSGKVNQVNFEGKFANVGATITATKEDLSDDIKNMIEWGFYTEDEILTKYASSGTTERKTILVRPILKTVDEGVMPEPMIFEERYTREELDNVGVVDAVTTADDDDDWLNDLV